MLVDTLKESYGLDMLNLTTVQAYLRRIMGNERVSSYLQRYHEDIYSKFSEIIVIDFLKITSTM